MRLLETLPFAAPAIALGIAAMWRHKARTAQWSRPRDRAYAWFVGWCVVALTLFLLALALAS